MKDNIKKMLREPSTWAGIAAVLVAAIGFDNLSAEQVAIVMAGIAAMVLPEGG